MWFYEKSLCKHLQNNKNTINPKLFKNKLFKYGKEHRNGTSDNIYDHWFFPIFQG